MEAGPSNAEPMPETAEENLAAESVPETETIEGEDKELLSKARKFISKITASQENPNPMYFHALASMIETQESRYLQDSATSSYNGGRSSHTIGRLANVLNENDEFVVSLSTKYLSESRYSVSIRAAAARLLLTGSSTWMVFDDTVIENAKKWVIEEAAKSSEYECTPTDFEMLKTYATGILAISLKLGGEIVEDALTSGLPAKIIRYLRLRVLGDPNSSLKDSHSPFECKHSSISSIRGREDHKGRSRNFFDSTHSGAIRIVEGPFNERSAEYDGVIGSRQPLVEEPWDNEKLSLESELSASPIDVVGVNDMISEHKEQTDDQLKNRILRSKYVGEGADGLSRRRLNRGVPNKGNGRANEGLLDSERTSNSPGTDLQVGSSEEKKKGRILTKDEHTKKTIGGEQVACKIDFDHTDTEDDDNDRFNCIVGLRDISYLVKKAVLAAEAEAKVANAPTEAVRAAGEAAAELVRTSALEEWRSTSDTEAAISAASRAASTVIEAALASAMSLSSSQNEDPMTVTKSNVDTDEELSDFSVPDSESVAQLREKYCIQCLEILGEYVEALGPVLHEKGVDICIALLQRSSGHSPDLLPEVLKMICALAAHRKFAALFVDRDGMQKLLSVQRNPQTFFGLSSCLFTIGSLQGIMERVCALPPDIVNKLVELALQLLPCSQDHARKNAAIFFSSAFVFRAVLDSFDTQEGLQKMLSLLHSVASVRSGGNTGTSGLSNAGGFQSGRSPSEVLSALEKQIAYHICVALRQYFRAHLLLLVDSLRPSKSNRSVARSNAKAAYKPLDISNEGMDAVITQIQRDRKFGPIFVKARWSAVDTFLASNGHITMLELCQAPPGERYLHDLAQYALGVLHIITLAPYSRKLVINASISNNRVGMAIILDAANGGGYLEPEAIQAALEVLVNLVCPPPSISTKPTTQGQQSSIINSVTGTGPENKERHSERNIIDHAFPLTSRTEVTDSIGEANIAAKPCAPSITSVPTMSLGVVGDRRISLGPGAGCAGFAAQLEQGYGQAREAVRANNGIKVLLHVLSPRMVTPPGSLDHLRALACKVLLGLARDDTIAHILTKLQVGKKLSELIRDSGSPLVGYEQGRWQTELSQVAIELIAIVTNTGRASTLVATDAAAPTLRRIERAAIAAATPITYHPKELLLLIHEHLQASGLTAAAVSLQREASLTPLPSVSAPQPPFHHNAIFEAPSPPIQWPSYQASSGFLVVTSKSSSQEEDAQEKGSSTSILRYLQKKRMNLCTSISKGTNQTLPQSSLIKISSAVKSPAVVSDVGTLSVSKSNRHIDHDQHKTPIVMPLKRKLVDYKDSATPAKRLAISECFPSPGFQTPGPSHRCLLRDTGGPSIPLSTSRENSRAALMSKTEDSVLNNTPLSATTPGLFHQANPTNMERMTLDSLVIQYLKHQHRQCPAPITTLPPLSLLHPHICPDPSRDLDAPSNVTPRLGTREFRKYNGDAHRRDRQFVYSRFRPWRTYRDDPSLLTCLTFLGTTSRFAAGTHSGEIKIFDSDSGNILESNLSNQSPVLYIDSAFSGDTCLILSSGSHHVKSWDASLISGDPLHIFEGCKAAHFSNSGTMFAALSSDSSRREVLLYDVQRNDLDRKFRDNSSSILQIRGHGQSRIHFSPLDKMLVWNGIMWDRRCSDPVHHFDQFTDYGGGGFHPAGNEVIINSEVWDLRKFKLLRSVPSLDQTVIHFNAGGDVIYATLRRNVEDITSAVNLRRFRNPLFAAFRTVDAVNYSDIATVPVDRCVLDLATDPTDSFLGVVAMDDHDNLFSSAKLYEIGRRRLTDDDSDPDDGADTDEEDEDEDDSDAAVQDLLSSDLAGDTDSDADDMSNDDDDIDSEGELDDADFNIGGMDFRGQGILEIETEDEDDSELVESTSDEDGDNDIGF